MCTSARLEENDHDMKRKFFFTILTSPKSKIGGGGPRAINTCYILLFQGCLGYPNLVVFDVTLLAYAHSIEKKIFCIMLNFGRSLTHSGSM